MKKLFRQALQITNNSIILAIPFIVFITILDLYSTYSRYTVDSMPKFILAYITVLFMFGVFCAGWFYMVKEAVNLSKKVFVLDSDRAKASFNLIKTIPEGVGQFFLSFVGVYILFFFIQLGSMFLMYFTGAKVIGVLDTASIMQIQALTSDPSNTQMANFVDKLTPEQIIFFGKWSLLFIIFTTLIMFLLMLWFPEIIYKTPNPVVALYRAVKKLFKNFFEIFKVIFHWIFVVIYKHICGV